MVMTIKILYNKVHKWLKVGNNMKIAICDDNKEICTQIENTLLKYSESFIYKLEVYVFYCGEDLINYIDKGNFFHLIYLDIEMKGQTSYLNTLNSQATNGEIAIANDLSITSFTPISRAGHWASCGGGKNTDVTHHWWGYSRYACDCETNRMSADFNSCASVAAGVGVIGSYFGAVGAIPGGISSAYWWLLASRLDANNHGNGVYVEMTWVLAFDITPQ